MKDKNLKNPKKAKKGVRHERKTDRRFAVLRLLPAEKELVAGLGQGPEHSDESLQTRDDVMRVLAEIARLSQPPGGPFQPVKDDAADHGPKGMQWKELAKKIGPIRLSQAEERSSLRVSMPESLDIELGRLAAITEHTRVALLLQLAAHFRKRYAEIMEAAKSSDAATDEPKAPTARASEETPTGP